MPEPRRLGWFVAAAVGVWITGIAGQVVLSAITGAPARLLLLVPSGSYPRWQVTAATWLSVMGSVGEVATKGGLAVLAAVGLRAAARRYKNRSQVDDVRTSTAPDRSAR